MSTRQTIAHYKNFHRLGYLLFMLLLFQNTYSKEITSQLSFTIDGIQISNQKPVYLTIPFPKGYFYKKQKLSLLWEKSEIPFTAYAHLYWPSINKSQQSVRAITIKLPLGINGQYHLRWDDNIGNSLSPHKLSYTNKLHEINLPVNWLKKITYFPIFPDKEKYRLKWFDESFEKYALYVTDENAIKKKDKSYSINKAAPWLYDKVYTLYQLYFKTGNLKWKNKAHEAALFYKKNIGNDGFFKLVKHKDLKMLMGKGLLYDYIFYPNNKTTEIINKMYKNSLTWPAKYSKQKGFWTERHLASAFNLSITEWELTNKKSSLQRTYSLLNNVSEHLSLNSADEKKCLLHKLIQHENLNDKVYVCSPWMTALLIDELWRFYSITENKLAKNIIIHFSDFIINDSVYYGTGKLEGYLIPEYLVFSSKSIYKERKKWDDRHHACDVSGMLAKSIYLMDKKSANYLSTKKTLNSLLKTCKKTAYHPHIRGNYWRLSPLRKFNWWFSSTTNLSWLYEEIAY